jgi:hypothetical protein
MTSRAITYTWSDTWLLLSILYAAHGSESASLTDVIAQGDAINHALFTPQELRRGTAKLTNDGYLSVENGRFFPSEKALEMHRGIAGQRSREQLDELREIMGAEYRAEDPKEEDSLWPYPQLTDETISQARAAVPKRCCQCL